MIIPILHAHLALALGGDAIITIDTKQTICTIASPSEPRVLASGDWTLEPGSPEAG